jgi:hypothetical protein
VKLKLTYTNLETVTVDIPDAELIALGESRAREQAASDQRAGTLARGKVTKVELV